MAAKKCSRLSWLPVIFFVNAKHWHLLFIYYYYQDLSDMTLVTWLYIVTALL